MNTQAIERIENARDFAREIYEANKISHVTPEVLAFDAGRYDAFKEALDLISKL